MIYICALVGSNKHSIKMHGTCIKIVEYLHCCLLRVTVNFTPDRKYVDNIQNFFFTQHLWKSCTSYNCNRSIFTYSTPWLQMF